MQTQYYYKYYTSVALHNIADMIIMNMISRPVCIHGTKTHLRKDKLSMQHLQSAGHHMSVF